ncbi:MAG: hypothetical protein IJ074_11930 [Clostridia bacterium]|nr:hypothetical protein [Clostridia bacterium]
MDIRWSSESAAEVIRWLKDTQQRLGDCLSEAAAARSAVEDAKPSEDSRAIEILLTRYDETVERMRKSQEAVEALAKRTEEARQRFEDAENTISRMLEAVAQEAERDPNAVYAEIEYRNPPILTRSAQIQAPIILPEMRVTQSVMVPDWLQALMNDDSLFQEWNI